jgi:hypothetical protein
MLRRYLLLPFVIAATILIAFMARTPSASSGGSGFDLTRAKADVAELARAPRPAGAAENARAHDWLVDRFSAMGLQILPQGGIGVRQANHDKRRKGAISVAPYRNVIAMLPGRDPTKEAVLLMAHYDSVPYAAGASDDAAGVATLLETARLLSKGPKPLRDVVFLATDAEEVGLIGAQEFFDKHPLASRVGAVVNVEARGSRGRAIMFQTSPDNGALIDLWAKNAIHPTGNSMANGVYQLLPNDTDLSVSLAKGKIGINAAFIDGLADYHMPTDSPANLDPGSLLDIGNFALTTTRGLANANALPQKTAEASYFDVFGLFVARYPQSWNWGLVALGLVGVAFSGIGRIGVSWGQALRATLGVVALTLGTGTAIHFLMQWLSGKGTIALLDRINEMNDAIWIFIAIVAAAVLVARPRVGMWVGGVIATLLFAAVMQVLLPGGTWIFIWAALLGIGLLFAASRLGVASPWVIYGSALIGALWSALLLEGLVTTYMTVAPASPAPMILIIPLALALLGPVLTDASGLGLGRKVGQGLLALSAAGLIWFAVTNSFSARHPKPADLFHVTDSQNGKSYWATTSAKSQLPAGASATIKPEGFKPIAWPATATPAANIDQPVVSLIEVGQQMELTISSTTPNALFSIAVKPEMKLQNARVNGKPVRIDGDHVTRISWRAEVPAAKIILAFDKVGGGKMKLHYLYSRPGLPANAPPRGGVPTDWASLNDRSVRLGSQTLQW